MTTNTVIPFEERVEKAAKILKTKPSKLITILTDIGIDGLDVLDSEALTPIQISEELPNDIPRLKSIAVAGVLKDNGCKVGEVNKSETSNSNAIIALLESQKPVASWSDEEILNGYIESDREDLETELQRRSKNRPFIILTDDTDPQEINVKASLTYLKRARKENIPSPIILADKTIIKTYKVEEYHRRNRVCDESPFKENVALFDNYCPVTKINFSNLSYEVKQFLRVISSINTDDHNQYRVWVASAESGGIEKLANEHPEAYEIYLEMKSIKQLPSLLMLMPMNTTTVEKSDPFNRITFDSPKYNNGYPINFTNKHRTY